MNTLPSMPKLSVSMLASLLLAAPLALAQQQPTPPPQAGGSNPPQGQYGGPQGDMQGQRPGPGDHMRGFGRGMHGANDGMREAMFGDMDDMADLDFGPMELPPGDWWKRPSVATRLSLTPDQVKRLDDLWLQSRLNEVQMHAQIEEQELRLEPVLSAPTVDQGRAQAALDKLAETRAALEKAQGKVMLSMRAVLTPDQWTKLHEHRPMGYGWRGGDGMPGGGPDNMPPSPQPPMQ